MYSMFYVNDEPEGKFLYTETIKLYCSAVYVCVLFVMQMLNYCFQSGRFGAGRFGGVNVSLQRVRVVLFHLLSSRTDNT